jgi:hypothetical protein
MDEIFAETFGKRLTSVGFTFIKRTKWTRVRTPGIRDLFEITLGKGHVYYPSWGFSLDFVPHVGGSTVRWHRTDKSSLLDLRDRQWPSAKGVWKLIGPDRARREAQSSARHSVDRAISFFAGVDNVADLLPLSEAYVRASPMEFRVFFQQPLAYAFALARLGQGDAAETQLTRCLDESPYSETVNEDLRRRLRGTQ